MTTLAFSSLSRTVRSPLLVAQGAQANRRWLHKSVARQAIMMPAISPFMTEGTITRWKKKEGESFSAGDILLQIESDIAIIDVEAESPGILGKILLPDGSTNVPVEKVIALVAKDDKELANLSAHVQAHCVPAPPYNHVPSPPSRVAPTSLPVENQNQPFLSPSLRSPSLFELHTMGDNHRRGMKMKHGRPPSLSIVPPSPQTATGMPSLPVLLSASTFHSWKGVESECSVDNQMDGAAIRRMIASNLARTPTSASAFDLPPNAGRCDTKVYFDGIL